MQNTLDYRDPRLEVAPDPRRRRTVGVLMLIAASILWSVSGVAVKKINMDPIGFAFWRSLAAGVSMIALLPFSRGRAPSP
ncbi:MAG: DMT family transporter, partial [Anaerolineae bacterium]|nr:DMT family transporter [Phycisphaerae bacterium]